MRNFDEFTLTDAVLHRCCLAANGRGEVRNLSCRLVCANFGFGALNLVAVGKARQHHRRLEFLHAGVSEAPG
jgi:hypothetical protein